MTTPAADVIAAYSATGGRWQHGPGRIYDRLAHMLVERSPVGVDGAVVADVGAGTGAGSRAARAAGAARVVAIDPAVGMLAADAPARPPAVAGDGVHLPLRSNSVDLGIAAFSFNHLSDPVPALAEMRRILRRGGGMIVGTYASDDTHPVKKVVEEEVAAEGWQRPAWYDWVRDHAMEAMATIDQVRGLAAAAGLARCEVERVRVPFPDLTMADLVAWRLGMAQHAPFVAALTSAERNRLVANCIARLDQAPTLTRSVLVMTWTSGQDPVDPRLQGGAIVGR